MKCLIKGLFLVLALGSIASHAEDLDPASLAALMMTQKLLVTPDARAKAVQQSPDAQMVDAQVRNLGGNPANTERIYKLSSDIFSDLVKECGGDATKLKEVMAKAKDDPRAFYEKLSEKNKQALKEISKQISDQPTTKRDPVSSH